MIILSCTGLSCDSNSVCMLGYRPKIRQIGAEGRESLRSCIVDSTTKIDICSSTLFNVTNSAIDRGQILLDDLGECSRKTSLAVIACYKNIITTDVIPVKLKLLDAITAHKKANAEVIQLRQAVNSFIDETIKKYRDLMEKTLREALVCS